jgi:hypothetical protein
VVNPFWRWLRGDTGYRFPIIELDPSMTNLLGLPGTDSLTGFKGTITGQVRFISGCNQLLLTPTVTADGSIRSPEWFDEQRIALGDARERVELDNGATPGFDRAPQSVTRMPSSVQPPKR